MSSRTYRGRGSHKWIPCIINGTTWTYYFGVCMECKTVVQIKRRDIVGRSKKVAVRRIWKISDVLGISRICDIVVALKCIHES